MKVIDVIFALVCGRMVGFLVSDYFAEMGYNLGFYYLLLIWVALPVISVICFYLAYIIGKKLLFVFQAAKFVLVGAFATVIDYGLFNFFIWTFSFFFPIGKITAKAISFIFSTALKYWGNKYWTFSKHEKEEIAKEILQFFIINLAGLIIDVAAFYYFTRIMGEQFGFSYAYWIKFSVILAAITSSVWNFLGYKFLVFKK